MNTNVFNSFRARILAGGAALLAVLVLGLALSLSDGLVRAQDMHHRVRRERRGPGGDLHGR